MGNSKRTRYKGHCSCCAVRDGRFRGQGWGERMSSLERRLAGRKRRVRRGSIPQDQL